MKWIGVVVLVIVGVLAAYVAVEYLTVSIGHLPSYIPGHKGIAPGAHHLPRGHYRKRGYLSALIALVAFVGAGYLTYRNVNGKRPRRAPAPTGTAAPTSADQII